MADIKIYRVLALPQTLQASSLYIVAAQGVDANDGAELYFSSQDGLSVRKLPSLADITKLVSQSNAATADKLKTARHISLTGDASWDVTFDGSANATGALTLTPTGVTAGEYPVVTVNAKGQVTAARALTSDDLPMVPGNKLLGPIDVYNAGLSETANTANVAAFANESGQWLYPAVVNGVNVNSGQDVTIYAEDAVTPRIAVTEKAVANGVATLDSNGIVPWSQLPGNIVVSDW